jgi:fatty acid desaturase
MSRRRLQRDPTARADTIELPTLAVALTIYGVFFGFTWFYADLPLWLVALGMSVVLAWYGSLQHETIHDHPTPWRALNATLACAPLSLWLPYAIYRDLHLRHHRYGGRYLTVPVVDPESFYLAPTRAAGLGNLLRALHAANTTLAGRLLVGPALSIGAFWAAEIRRIRAGDARRAVIWARHLAGIAFVLGWVVGICHIPWWAYVGLMVYPGVGISLLRSFAEHRAHHDPRMRTVVVETNRFWGLLFLNNNLHIVHHAQASVPWYELPRLWRGMRAHYAGTPLVHEGGYAAIAAAHCFKPILTLEHPVRPPLRAVPVPVPVVPAPAPVPRTLEYESVE